MRPARSGGSLIETEIEIRTPDGMGDGLFYQPERNGGWPGVFFRAAQGAKILMFEPVDAFHPGGHMLLGCAKIARDISASFNKPTLFLMIFSSVLI